MDKENLAAAFQRYIDYQYSREDFKLIQDHFQKEGDRELIISWINNELENEEFSQEVIEKTNEVLALVDKKLFEGINQVENRKRPTRKALLIKTIGFKIAIAASILLIGTASLFYFNHTLFQDSSDQNTAFINDINPGGNRATLTLADGNTINLSDKQDGIIIGENDITYEDGNTVGANLRVRPLEMQASTLTLQTPKGGKYQITLPDGTKVWLNAASTLKYPSHFSGPDRKVELIGEAYFEVAKNIKQPFVVNSEEQEIKVLGTQFNINAYNDAGTTSTTLIEGSVQLNTPKNTTIFPANNPS